MYEVPVSIVVQLPHESQAPMGASVDRTEADGSHNPMPPGFRESGWTDPAFFEEMAKMAARRMVGIGRPAHPTEVAAAVAFFGSPEASFVTGQHLGASGGVAMLELVLNSARV